MFPKILIVFLCMCASSVFAGQTPVRYVALGDSYTIGTGALPGQSWPALVTERLQQKGMAIELVANLGHNGWTSQDLIDGELPLLKELKPDFVTLLIGTNDWVHGVDAQTFKQNVHYILSELLKLLPGPQRILLITVPDFSVTPAGQEYAFGRDIAQGLKAFNQVLLQEAAAYNVKTIDLYPLSETITQDHSMIASDGLHPSAKGYSRWADLIEPQVEKAYAGFNR